MSYKVLITDRMHRRLTAWQLPDAVLVDVWLKLRESLSDNPSRVLVRTTEPFDGLVCPLAIINPANRLEVFRFFFHVIYGQDETTLYVVHGALMRTLGW